MNTDIPFHERLKKVIRRYDPDPVHAGHVRFLALRLFDDLQRFHRMGPRERDVLEVAALLHDIGMSRGTTQHHKHSRDIILSLNIRGFSRDDIRLCAQVARYHRSAEPDSSRHSGLRNVSPEFMNKLEWLAGILRVADGLDRGHRSAVKNIRCRILPERVIIELSADRACGLEHCGGIEKSALLKRKMGVPITCNIA